MFAAPIGIGAVHDSGLVGMQLQHSHRRSLLVMIGSKLAGPERPGCSDVANLFANAQTSGQASAEMLARPSRRWASISASRKSTMTACRFAPYLSAFAISTLAACTSMGGGGMQRGSAANDTDTAVVVLPTSGAVEQMRAGCWVSFYDERNFGGDSLTLIGPVDLQTLDRGSARQLKRDIKSIVTGPRATLVLYEKQFLSARSVGFQPGSRESGLVEKLGFGGRVESMRLSCG